MELTPGYKRTELGFIPDDWELMRLGDVAYISSGGTPLRGVAEFWDGDIPWITTAQVDGGTICEAREFISQSGLSRSSAKLYPPGTILLAMYGQGKTRGKAALLGIAATTNQACAALQLKPGVCADFVFRFLVEKYAYIRALSNSGSQENLSLKIVADIPIILPTVAEQFAIAEVLSDADASIAVQSRLVAKKRDLRHGIVQRLLGGKVRLQGFGNKGSQTKETEIGTIPEDWELMPLGHAFEIQLGKMLDAEKNIGDLKPYLGNRAVQWGRIDVAELPLMRMTPSDLSKFRLQKGDLLVCEGGEVGRCAIYAGDPVECYYQKALHRLRSKGHVDPRLLVPLFRLYSELGIFSSYVTQTSIAHLPKEKLALVPVPRIDAREQQAILGVIHDADAEIEALEARLEKYRALKQAMMQVLLTGRVRLARSREALAQVKEATYA